MCIRDSTSSSNDTGSSNDTSSVSNINTEENIVQEAVETAPVSYTHLRAHETVLDLVCRLLLEKKKQTQKCTTI